MINDKDFSLIVDEKFFSAKSLEDVLNHELGGHKRHWEAVETYYKENGCRTLGEAKKKLESNLREYIVKQTSLEYSYLKNNISENAFFQFLNRNILNESIADAIVLIEKGVLQDETLAKLILEVISYDGESN